MPRQKKVFQSPAIESAVMAGDIEKLQKLVQASTMTMVQIGKQKSRKFLKTLLHYAVLSRNLAMVQFVTEYFEVDPNIEYYEGCTALALACKEFCPVEIITYLIDRKGTMGADEGTPLQFAVRHSWYDLLWALQAKLGLEPTPELLHIVVTETGDVNMLQYLLDTYNDAALRLLTQKTKGKTILEHLAYNGRYELERKVACFKMLFKLVHPDAAYTSDPERYNLNDIMPYALLNTSSASLVPYFIETERKWENRAPVLSLYDRLLFPEKKSALALTVLCEYGLVVGERKELNYIPSSMSYYPWYYEIKNLYKSVIDPSNEDEAADAAQLLEDFAIFWKSKTLHWFDDDLMKAIETTFNITVHYYDNKIERLYQPSFHRAVSSMITIYNDKADRIAVIVLGRYHTWRVVPIFALLRYCTTLLMRPKDHFKGMDEVFKWFMHLFGPWKAIQQHVGEPKLELFTLQRFARDVVRESVWQGVKGRNGPERLFLDRLQSLNLPKELLEYLRYCDDSSTEYIAKHFDAIKDKRGLVYGYPYPFAL